MHFTLQCPACQNYFDIPQTMAGQQLACPHCHRVLQMPAALPSSPAATPRSFSFIPLLYIVVITSGVIGLTAVIRYIGPRNTSQSGEEAAGGQPPKPPPPQQTANQPPKPAFDPKDIGKTQAWIEHHLNHLEALEKAKNELQYQQAVAEVTPELTTMQQQKVKWTFTVERVSADTVFLDGVSTGIQVSTAEDFNGWDSFAGFGIDDKALTLNIGNQISIEQARVLKQGSGLRVSATITRLEVLPKIGQRVYRIHGVAIGLSDITAAVP